LDATKSLRYPFEDQEWPAKLGLGAIISLVPILNFAWSGYMVEILRNVMNQVLQPLPTWENLETKFREGLILFGASLIYAAPILLFLCLPLSLIASSGVLAGNTDLQEIGERLAAAAGILFAASLCVLGLYALVLSILYPAMLVLFAREGTFASCFRLREAWGLISNNAASFFTAWALSILAGIGVGLLVGFVNLVVGFVPCVGWILGLVVSMGSGVYLTAVYAHLFGQFAQAAFGQNQLVALDSAPRVEA
jgi:hypothetical protein